MRLALLQSLFINFASPSLSVAVTHLVPEPICKSARRYPAKSAIRLTSRTALALVAFALWGVPLPRVVTARIRSVVEPLSFLAFVVVVLITLLVPAQPAETCHQDHPVSDRMTYLRRNRSRRLPLGGDKP